MELGQEINVEKLVSDILAEVLADVCADPMQKKKLRRSHDYLKLSVPKQKLRVDATTGKMIAPKSDPAELSR